MVQGLPVVRVFGCRSLTKRFKDSNLSTELARSIILLCETKGFFDLLCGDGGLRG